MPTEQEQGVQIRPKEVQSESKAEQAQSYLDLRVTLARQR